MGQASHVAIADCSALAASSFDHVVDSEGGLSRQPASGVRHAQARLTHKLLAALYAKLQPDCPMPEVTQDAHGKPRFVSGNIQFNLSHSGRWSIAAMSPDQPIGVDIEQLRPKRDWAGIANRFFSPAENDWLRLRQDAEKAFYRLWVIREAVLKRSGIGVLGQAHLEIDPRAQYIHQSGGPAGVCLLWDWEDSPVGLCTSADVPPPLFYSLGIDGTLNPVKRFTPIRYIVLPR